MTLFKDMATITKAYRDEIVEDKCRRCGGKTLPLKIWCEECDDYYFDGKLMEADERRNQDD